MASTAAVLNILVNASTGKASADLRRFNGELKATEGQAGRSTVAAGKVGKALKLVGIGAAAGAAYGLYKAVGAGATFEKQMDSLGAVSEATGKQMKRLEKQALALGESTQYTANQVAEAQTELAKGGLTLKQIMGGGLKSALSLAAAGELDLAEAASTTVNAMKLFGLEGKDSMKVADMLATAANKTTADVGDFALALKQGGGVAKLAGMNFNETVTVLEALAEAGYKGSDAGTSLKSFFINIGTPSVKAKEMMEELGLSIFTAGGKLKELPALSANLRDAFGELTEQQFLEQAGTIAGSDAIRSLYALYEAGPKKLKALEQANARNGTAQDVARKKMDNLKGDWEQFTGALETGGIKLYKVLKGPLRDATQWLTGAVQAISNFDYGKAFGEVEEFYERLHDSTNIEFAGASFSLAPETAELQEALQWSENAFKNYATAIGKIYNWLGNASVNTFNAVAAGARWAVTAFNDFIGAIQAGVSWISRAWDNVTGFVQSLIPFKVAVIAVKLAIAPVVGLVMGLFKAFKILSPFIVMVAQNFKSVWVAAVKVAMAVIQVLLKFIGNIAAVFGDVVGVISNLLRGKWGAAWKDAKQLFVDVWHTILDLLKGGWTVIKTLFSAGVKALTQILGNSVGAIGHVIGNIGHAMKEAFEKVWDGVSGVFGDGVDAIKGFIQDIADVINPLLDAVGIGEIHITGGGGEKTKAGTLGAPHKGSKSRKQRGGTMMGGKPSGDSIPALLERGEYVLNRNAVKAVGQKQLDAINFGAASRFQLGGPIGMLSGGDVWGAVKDVAGYTTPGLAYKAARGAINTGSDLAKGASYFMNGLPGMEGKGIFSEVGNALVGKVKDWIGGLPGNIFDSGSGSVDLSDISGSVASQAAQIAKRTHSPKKATLALFEALWAESSMGDASPGNVLQALEPYTQVRPAAQEISGFLTGHPTWTGTAAIPTARGNPGLPAHAVAQLVQKSGVGEGNEGRANYMLQKGRALATMAKFGLAEGGLVGMAAGGMAGTKNLWSGVGPSGLQSGIRNLAAYVMDQYPSLQVTSTTGGTHAANSLHYSGQAVDLAGSGMDAAAGWIKSSGLYKALAEGIHNPNLSVDEGKLVDPSFYSEVWAGHRDHIHLGVTHPWTKAGFKGGSTDGSELPEGIQKAHEGKARKAAREKQLAKLRGAVHDAKTDPSKNSKLWQLIKFWGRNGIFDKDERGHILDSVREAASKVQTGESVKVLQNLASYTGKHGEITGKEPDNWKSLVDAIDKAQEQGKKIREKTVDRLQHKKERLRNKRLGKIQKRGELSGLVEQLDKIRGTTDRHEEVAGQLVTLEPENLTDDYVGRERGSYEGILGDLLGWRNQIVWDRYFASGKINEFEQQIGSIQSLKGKPAFQKQKYKLPALREAVANATAFRDEALIGELEEIQGAGGSLDFLSSIPTSPTAGQFGGRIFEVQNTIRELGLKTGGATETSSTDNSERLAFLEEQLRQANQRNLVFERQSPIVDAYIAKNFAGMFAKGGSIAAGQWGIAGEAGPEIIQGPAQVFSNSESAGMASGGVGRIVVEDKRIRVYDRSDKEIEEVALRVNRAQGKAATLRNPRAGRIG